MFTDHIAYFEYTSFWKKSCDPSLYVHSRLSFWYILLYSGVLIVYFKSGNCIRFLLILIKKYIIMVKRQIRKKKIAAVIYNYFN